MYASVGFVGCVVFVGDPGSVSLARFGALVPAALRTALAGVQRVWAIPPRDIPPRDTPPSGGRVSAPY